MYLLRGKNRHWKISLFLVIVFISASQTKAERHESMSTEEKFQNRLIHEKSPYLLQHANNPVDWYPWSEEAFSAAKSQDKPIFLSIGYSTCHWCHVMEHKSFEDPKIARMINDYFVPIKVDREERPDVDHIYMSAVQAMTGSGGWPLSIFLTHEKKPFFGGTYFPPRAKWGSPGFIDVLQSIHHAWKNNRQQLITSSDQLTKLLEQQNLKQAGQDTVDEKMLEYAALQFKQMYDSRFGGFGISPKFPTSHNLSFLLRYWQRTSDPEILSIVEHTLIQMAHGGMYDHLGGGFHRYATDQEWQIPHFEKMLYDQAILAKTYLEAFQITKNEFYAQIAREIFDYCLRDLTDPKGGFYSAEDADSLDPNQYKDMSLDSKITHEKKEGAFYLWQENEIDTLLGREDAKIFKYYFGIENNGNAHSDPHGEFVGKNILFVRHDLKKTAQHFKLKDSEVRTVLNRSKAKLFQERETRPRPHLDDKVLVDWNGLMISSLAFGSKVLNEPKYKEAAEDAAQFILNNLVDKRGRLLHRYRDQDASILGMIEDYAFFINGLLDLYEVTFDLEYLVQAHRLSKEMMKLFWDKERGGFFLTANDAQKLILRPKEVYDGAIPSGNSFAALVLVRLAHMMPEEKWENSLEELFKSFARDLKERPSAYAQMMIALDFALGPSQEIVIAGLKTNPHVVKMHEQIYDYFLPNKVVLLHHVGHEEADQLIKMVPFIKNQTLLEGQPAVYVCENHTCKKPVSDLSKFREILQELVKRP